MRSERFVLALAMLSVAGIARADIPVEVVDRAGARITLDGLLSDWTRARELTAVEDSSQVVQGRGAWTGADDASFGFALARDDQGLWLAAEVRDDRVLRSRQHRPADDTLVLSLAVGTEGHLTAWDVAFQPGEPGSYAGVVRFTGTRSGGVPGAQLVEGPLPAGGFTLEAMIPWSAVPDLRPGLSSLRARLAFHDADREGAASESVIATGGGEASRAAALPLAVGSVGTAGPGNLLAMFQLQMGLGNTSPVLDRAVDLAGDRAQERLVVFPQYLLAFGPGIAGGQRYVFAQLPGRAPADMLDTTVRDLTGDGRAEVTLRVRTPSDSFERELLMVYGITAAGELDRLFVHEVARSAATGRLSDRVSFEAGNRIRLEAGPVQGFSATSWPNAHEPGVPLPLAPWTEHREEVWAWSPASNSFALERSAAGNVGTAGGGSSPAVGSAGAGTGTGTGTRTLPGAATLPPDVEGVLAMYREQAGLPPNVPPAIRVLGNVAEDRVAEQVLVFGRTLLVVGPRFMGGRSYTSIELPASNPEDVLSLQLMDLTGDGRQEAVLRVRRSASLTVRGQPATMVKEFVLAYSFDAARRGRVFAAEVSRRVGEEAIENRVQLPRGRGRELVIEAGRAREWTAETYPFRDAPAQGFEPLLLPWDPASQRVRFRWNGTSMERQP